MRLNIPIANSRAGKFATEGRRRAATAGRARTAADGAAEGGGALDEAGQPVARAELADAEGTGWRRLVDYLELHALE
jgi:hypothetical protein